MSETNGAQHLQRQMAQVRHELTEDVQGIREKVQDLKDWRGFVRRHPWAVAAGAAAVGYLLVPKRPRMIYADAEALAELAQTQPLHVQAGNAKQGSVVGGLFRAATSSVMHGLVAIAGRQLGAIASQVLSNRVDRASEDHPDHAGVDDDEFGERLGRASE